ncbi:putative galectin [Trypoxylus dichotomus]
MSHTYIWPLSHGFNDGDSVVMKGSLPSEGIRFDINFHTDSSADDGDILFHMSNRYGVGHDQIVFNTREENVGWLTEEIYNGTGALAPGTFFTISIVLSGDQFSIAINGHHFANFNVRQSTSFIRYLSITGEVELSSITLAQMTSK